MPSSSRGARSLSFTLNARELRLGLLARQAAADAGAEHHPAVRDLVEGRPLRGEEDRVAQRKRREAARAEPHAPRAGGDRRQQHERLEPRLGEEAVADPDRLEGARSLGLLGELEQLVDARGAEQHAAVRQAQPEARRHSVVLTIRPVASTNQRSLGNDTPSSVAAIQSAIRIGGNGPRFAAGTLPTE